MSQTSPPAAAHRRRLAPAALGAGVIASAALALSLNGTLAAFTATIVNNSNTAASGTLTMSETNNGTSPATVCNSTDASQVTAPASGQNVNTNSATCGTINKYGGSTVLVPGGAATTTTVTLKNTGTVPANTFTVLFGTCVNGSNGATNGSSKLCDKLDVVLTQTATTTPGGTTTTTSTVVSPANSTATSLNGTTFQLSKPVAAGAAVTYSFATSLDTSADNTYQGLTASQNITWQFTS